MVQQQLANADRSTMPCSKGHARLTLLQQQKQLQCRILLPKAEQML
jgi:hypothetical protein